MDDESTQEPQEETLAKLITKRILGIVFDIIQTFVIALAVFVVLYQFVAQPHQVRGASMEPNFYDQEYILTEKVSYYFGKPMRSDVIVFKYPQNPDFDYIKRIVALPGEEISIKNGSVFINGQKLDEGYLPTNLLTTGHSFLPEGKSFVVPNDQYVVFGDNRNRSSDSREWGTVPKELIIGKAFFVYWPPKDVGFVIHASY